MEDNNVKNKKSPIWIIISVFIIGVLITGSVVLVKRYMPTKERVDLLKFFEADQEDTVLFLNFEKAEEKAELADGEYYLPITLINESINHRFYWDPVEEKLLYALPEELVEMLPDEKDENGKALMLQKDGEEYVSITLVEKYSDMVYSIYEGAEGIPGRLFIRAKMNESQDADVKKETQIREKGGIKSPIIADVEAGSRVSILETMETWSLVAVDTGFIGYIKNDQLSESYLNTRDKKPDPIYTSISKDYEINMVWNQVTVQKANLNLESLISKAKGVNTVSPTWYILSDNEGNFSSLSSKTYVDKAHAMGLEVWPLISDLDNNVNNAKVLTASSNRKRLIDGLMKEAETNKFDGLNIDFERISKDTSGAYLQFLRELSIECRARGLVLSIDNYVPTESNTYYNRTEQGIIADYVVIMGYDEHWSGSDPGSVSSISFTRNGILNTLKEVPAEKVIHGVPFYTRLWKDQEPPTAFGMSKARKILTDKGIEPVWLEDIGQFYGEYEEDGATYKIWLEDAASLELKMQEIAKNNLAGVAYWKLGLESDDVWDVIEKYVNSEE